MEEFVRRIISYIRTFFRERLHYQAEDLPYYITIAAALILFIVGLNVFVDITQDLAQNQLTDFDNKVTQFFVSRRTPCWTNYLVFVTNVGTRTGYFIVAGLLAVVFFLLHRNWKFILQTVIVLLLASASNMALKEVFNRARPTIEHMVKVYTLSYPSGHAMSAMGFYGFLVFLVVRYKMNFALKILLVVLLVTLILSIGISRIYLGVHYPSDVAAGFIGGLITVTFCAIIFDVVDLWRKRNQRRLKLKSSEATEPVKASSAQGKK